MLKKRIIPCLDIQNGRTVKGVNFIDIKDAGDPVELAKRYVTEGADELVFLDIIATTENRKTTIKLVERIAAEINIPFTVGGGISTVTDASALISAGADKISINSAAVNTPELITQIAGRLGSQCVVVAIDALQIERQKHDHSIKAVSDDWIVMIHGGRTKTSLSAFNWARQAEQLGAGEILLTSMNHDGTKNGFAVEITNKIASSLSIPVIASGGAGSPAHFKEIFENSRASGALAASVFHFGEIPIPELKKYLIRNKIPVRCN